MWIRSQDRRSLLNVNLVRIRDCGDRCLMIGALDRYEYELGLYSTKEKALSVLDDIQFQVKYFDPDTPLFYEMPKDEEVEV